MKHICYLNRFERYCSYFSAGICVLDNGQSNQVVVDILNEKAYEVVGEELKYEEVANLLVGTDFGLSL